MAEIINDDPFYGDIDDVIDDVIDLIDERFTSGFFENLYNWSKSKNIRSFYIGQSYDTITRAQKHGKKYDYMDIVYETDNYEECQEMESLLIEEYEDEHSFKNMVGGGGGKKPPHGPYFVYVAYNIGPAHSKYKNI